MKIYMTPASMNGFDGLIRNALEEDGLEYADCMTCGGFEYVEEALKTSDAYITFFSVPGSSYTRAVELNMAMSQDLPVIAIRESLRMDQIGNIPFDRISTYSKLAVFDMPNGVNLDAFPTFIKEHIEKCQGNNGSQGVSEGRKPDRPYTGNEPHIFVSYAHKDMRSVFEIIREMQNRGYRVWYDEGIDPASEWDQNIAEHVNNCSYMIAFISPNYIASQNCKDEISYARDLNKERLLVYLEDTKLPVGMAMRLMRLQAIHKYKYKVSSDFYDKLFSAHGIEVAK